MFCLPIFKVLGYDMVAARARGIACSPVALAEEASKGAVLKSIMLRLMDTHAHLAEPGALHIALKEASAVG
jgi:hypothetical protein